MDKKKKLRNQKRNAKRGLHSRQHRSGYLAGKRAKNRSEIKSERNFVANKQMEKKMKASLKFRLKVFWYKFKRATQCRVGWHSMKLQSGKPGTSKYLCANPACFRGSRDVWQIEDFVNQPNQKESYVEQKQDTDTDGDKLGDK